MTVGTQINRVVGLGDGASMVFVYPFLIRDASEAVVTLANADGTMQQLSPLQYTITGLGDPVGGTVIYPLSPPALGIGQSLVIQRILPFVQTTSIRTQGPTFAAIEDGMDNLEMQIQQVQDEYSRTIQFNITDPHPHNTLPPISQLAGQMLGFDAQGNPIAAQPANALVSSAMQPVVAASTTAQAFSLLAGSAPTFTNILVTTNAFLNNLEVAGSIAANNPAATTTIGGTLAVIGPSDLSDVNIAGNLSIANPAGTTTVGGTLAVVGPADFGGVNVKNGILFGPGASIGMVAGPTDVLAINAQVSFAGLITTPGAIVAAGSIPGSDPHGAWLGPDGLHDGGPGWSAPIAVRADNGVQATGFFCVSDEQTKKDIRDLTVEEAEQWLRAGRPRKYIDIHGIPSAGFVAQEDVVSGRGDAVSREPAGSLLTRNYNQDVAYLTRVVVWLMDRVAALEGATP